MRHRRTSNHQRPRPSIGRLLHEIVERASILEDIRSLFLSLLTQAQNVLRLYEQGCFSDSDAMLSFRRRTAQILDDVRASLRELGDGSEENRLLLQADHVEEVIRRVTSLVLDDGDLLTERRGRWCPDRFDDPS